MSAPYRIDVHQHVVPPVYAKALPTHGGDPSGTITPQWSPESAIDFMDSQEIATGILSLTAPSVVRWEKSERREMARRVNESISSRSGPIASATSRRCRSRTSMALFGNSRLRSTRCGLTG